MTAKPKQDLTRLVPWLFAWLSLLSVSGLVSWVYGLNIPIGPDPAMWGLAAATLRNGANPEVAIGFPFLMAAGEWLSGLKPWQVGLWVSLLSSITLPVATLAVAQRIGLPLTHSVLAAILTALHIDLFEFGYQLQPDSITALLALCIFAVGVHWQSHPGWRSFSVLIGMCVLLSLFREHGPIMLGTVLLIGITRWKPSVGVLLLGGFALMGIVIVLMGGVHSLPHRVALPLIESPLGAGTVDLPSYAPELGGASGEHLQGAWRDGDTLGVWSILLGRFLWRHLLNLPVIVLGAAGLIFWSRHRAGRPVHLAGLVALSPILAFLFIWSHRRHTSVLMPVAILGMMALFRLIQQDTRLKWVPHAILALLVTGLAWQIPATLNRLSGAAHSMRESQTLAHWMQEKPGTWFLGGTHNEVNLFLEWPRNNPALPPPGEPLPRDWSGTDWMTLWVAPAGTMPPPFAEVHRHQRLSVYQLKQEVGTPRPCRTGQPVDTFLFTSTHRRGHTVPTCSGRAVFGDRPPASIRPWQGQPFRPPDAPQ